MLIVSYTFSDYEAAKTELLRLYILEQDSTGLALNSHFRTEMKNAITGGWVNFKGEMCFGFSCATDTILYRCVPGSFGEVVTTDGKEVRLDTSMLDVYAAEQWEVVP